MLRGEDLSAITAKIPANTLEDAPKFGVFGGDGLRGFGELHQVSGAESPKEEPQGLPSAWPFRLINGKELGMPSVAGGQSKAFDGESVELPGTGVRS